jgi:hypothetical protein
LKEVKKGDPMPEGQKITRKMRAILYADVKGYEQGGTEIIVKAFLKG